MWRYPMQVPTDSTALLLPAAPAGKWKFNGPVTIIMQRGNNNVANPTATGKAKGDAVALGPAQASAVKPSGTPWWVYGLLAGVVIGLVVVLLRRFTWLRVVLGLA
ncbi:hypothetical protein MUN81_10490 [Hymenobacter sp. 5317J-9]|uniref:hypothetical protein n=1 Tax=Hymenobacter sp. 5317J-9 TaxID=2932250 RepID=UPI001FD6C405|nr:hypothetical protein [Hymenobacter sp. 5317J-9]UOQ99907.1 hypothetical protein MUN81_10490 [Hymenobacter sp. 5317J-9]